MIIMKKFLVILSVLLVFSSSAFSLTMTEADFGRVEQGDRVVKEILIGADDSNNTYVLRTEGKIGEWIKISPKEIFVPKKAIGIITLILEVPEDAADGAYNGKIVARGKDVLGSSEGTGVGIMLEIKSRVAAIVGEPVDVPPVRGEIQTEEIESFSIIDLYAKPMRVTAGRTVQIYVKIINTGTVPTMGYATVEITKDNELIDTFASGSTLLNKADEHLIQFNWNTVDLRNGTYKIMAYSKTGQRPLSFGPFEVVIGGEGIKEDPIKEEVVKKEAPYLLYVILFLIALVALRLFYRYKKSKKD